MFEGSVEGRPWEIPGASRWSAAVLLAYGTRFHLGWTPIEDAGSRAASSLWNTA